MGRPVSERRWIPVTSASARPQPCESRALGRASPGVSSTEEPCREGVNWAGKGVLLAQASAQNFHLTHFPDGTKCETIKEGQPTPPGCQIMMSVLGTTQSCGRAFQMFPSGLYTPPPSRHNVKSKRQQKRNLNSLVLAPASVRPRNIP